MNLDCQMQVVSLKTLCKFLFKKHYELDIKWISECRDMTLQKC